MLEDLAAWIALTGERLTIAIHESHAGSPQYVAREEMNEMPIPRTIDIQTVGVYQGLRISGTSDAVDDVLISRYYAFAAFGLVIQHIPAKRDTTSGRIFVSAHIAKRVKAKVQEYDAVVKGLSTAASRALSTIHPDFSVDASDFLRDAA